VAIVLVDYRNGVVMSWASQQRTEQANGTTYSSGLDLTGPVTGDGSADVDAEVAITNGILALGDIQIDVTDGAAGRFRQDLAPIAQLPVYSLDGAGPVPPRPAPQGELACGGSSGRHGVIRSHGPVDGPVLP